MTFKAQATTMLSRYAFTILVITLATILRFALEPVLDLQVPFILYFPATVLCAWYGGLWPGVLSTILGGLVACYLFIPPQYSIKVSDPSALGQLIVFLSAGALINLLAESLHRARNREREQRERFHVTLASIGDAVIATDATGRVTFTNQVADSLIGWKPDEVSGKRLEEVFNIVNERTREPGQNPALRAMKEGGIVGLANHTVLIAKDGTEIPIDDSGAPIRDSQGNTLGAVLVFRNITDRRRAEKELVESRDQLRMAMEASQMGTWTRELDDSNRTRWSPELEHIFGLDAGEFPETEEAFFDFVHPDDRDALRRAVVNAVENRSEYAIEFRYTRKGETVPRWMAGRGRAFYTSDGRPFRLAGFGWDITERKRAEEAVRESEQRFRLVADAAPVLIWVSGTDKLCTWFNRPWLEFVGRTMEQELGNGWAENVHPDDLDRCLHIYTTSFDAREPFSMTYRFRRHDGEYRWVLDNGIPRFGSQGEFSGYIGSCVDMTEREQAEERLRQQREWFRVTLSSIGDAVIATDTDAVITFMNPVAESLTGWKQEEAVGQPLQEVFKIVNEQTRQMFENPALRAMREGVIVGLANHTTMIAKDGSEIAIDDSEAPIKDAEGATLGAVLIFRDITERRLAEDKFRVAVESAPNAMIIIDHEGRIILINSQTERLFGYSRDELIGQPIEVLVPERYRGNHPDYRAGFARVPQARPMGAGRDLFGLRKDGSEVPVEIGLNPINIKGKTLVLSSIVDISERRRAEQERVLLLAGERVAREQAEAASRAKDEFVAMVSHEVRSPLNSILGWTQMLRTGKFDAAETARALETIERNAKNQLTLVEDLLDISRIVTGKLNLDFRAVDPTQIIEVAIDSIRPAAEAKSIQLRVNLTSRGSLVSGDPDRLRQIVWNLLSNAVKFTPTHGQVEVRVERIDSHLRITVSDSGAGISAKFLPYVFDRFSQANTTTQRRHGGLGLGLAIVRHLVELHGGTVRADSPGEGQGTTFTVMFPVRVVRERISELEGVEFAEAVLSPAGAVILRDLRVMVVDDDAETRDLLMAILTHHGAEVKTCASAAEAIDAIEQWQPSVLVSDIGMPVEDGYVFMRKLRTLEAKRGGNIPAVALTAYARSEDRTHALAAGFQMHIPKPVEAIELVMVVASLAGRRTMSA